MSASRAAAEPGRERVVALVLLLQRAWAERRALTQEEIVRDLTVDEYPVTSKSPRKVRAYEGNDAAVRQKFERDKARIRDLGFQIETVVRADDLTGYQIDPSSGYAPPLHFTRDESRVVATALGFCGFGKSGAFSVFNEGPAGDGGLEFSAYLTPAIRAIKVRRTLRFDYQSSVRKERVVEPLEILHQGGTSYLVAREVGAGMIKGYRFSRMTSMPVVLDESFHVDEATRELAASWRPQYQRRPTPIDVVVWTNRDYADLLVRQYDGATAAHKKDGRVEVGITFDSPHAALRFVLEGAQRVRLVSPKSLIKELRQWLVRVNRGKTPSAQDIKFTSATAGDVLGQTLQLLHAVYNAEDGLRISELANRFSLAPELVRSIMGRLVTMEPMVGAFDGATGFAARIIKDCDDWDHEDTDDSTYRVEFVSEDDEPSSFMWRDLFELNVALREASRLFEDPAIFSAIDKIEEVTSHFMRVEHPHNEQLLSQVYEAVTRHEQLKITYVSGTTEVAEERCIEPTEVKVLNGHSYVRAYCLTRDDWRTFRVDRIGKILAKSPASEPRGADPVANWLTAVAEEGDEVVVVLEGYVRYLFEPLPGARWATLADGRHAVRFHLSDPAFLDHLMILAGPAAVVATEKYATAGHDVAQRMLSQL
ncbi:MAG: WYL domain-containing protein [Acidobacteriota bacterium]|nr:WYL domain-containing protein [Acidobacteriota bacterium]MDE3030419.1 WYL domain-containing protein [Acidobacteriota bacterium]MDE3093520.1 WYL domain-containing protein [Acidobacteriota bacterium]MDE3139304.1 WYL domain-containing protein [Acidobacteriota bacterium]MDE3147151.1 WYL domain-containing protein [Acidobacteriota bacterium]